MKESLRKVGKGNVMLIPVKNIEEEVFHFNIRETLMKNNCLFFKKSKTVVLDSRLKKGEIQFQDLVKIRILGEGQFGKVFLVEDEKKGNKYALKCMYK